MAAREGIVVTAPEQADRAVLSGLEPIAAKMGMSAADLLIGLRDEASVQHQETCMKIRAGRHQDRNLYIQLGDEPSDEDEYLGVIFDPARAAVLIDIVNGDWPPLGDRGDS